MSMGFLPFSIWGLCRHFLSEFGKPRFAIRNHLVSCDQFRISREDVKGAFCKFFCADEPIASTPLAHQSHPPPPPAEDGTRRDKQSVISCVVVRDDRRMAKNSNAHERLCGRCIYDASRTTAKNYFSSLAISIPASSTILNFVQIRTRRATSAVRGGGLTVRRFINKRFVDDLKWSGWLVEVCEK